MKPGGIEFFFFMAAVYDTVYNLSQRGIYRIKSAVLKELGLSRAKRNTGAITGSLFRSYKTSLTSSGLER